MNMLTKNDFEQIENIIVTALKPIKKDVRILGRNFKAFVKAYNEESLDLLERVERIEEHLRLN